MSGHRRKYRRSRRERHAGQVERGIAELRRKIQSACAVAMGMPESYVWPQPAAEWQWQPGEIDRIFLNARAAEVTCALPPNFYRCSECRVSYEKGRDDAEAYAESDALFPNSKREELAIVCDDCWRRIMGRNQGILGSVSTAGGMA